MTEEEKKMNNLVIEVKEHTFACPDVHTLMDIVDEQIRRTDVTPESTGHIDYLRSLKDKVMALWIEVLPGQEAVCTIRERKEL